MIPNCGKSTFQSNHLTIQDEETPQLLWKAGFWHGSGTWSWGLWWINADQSRHASTQRSEGTRHEEVTVARRIQVDCVVTIFPVSCGMVSNIGWVLVIFLLMNYIPPSQKKSWLSQNPKVFSKQKMEKKTKQNKKHCSASYIHQEAEVTSRYPTTSLQ